MCPHSLQTNSILIHQTTPLCSHLSIITQSPKGICEKTKIQIDTVLPAGVSWGDGDEGRGAQWQCCGPRRNCDGVRLRLAIKVVLFCLPKGQRGQLDGTARQPPHQEGLHAGDWPRLRGVWWIIRHLECGGKKGGWIRWKHRPDWNRNKKAYRNWQKWWQKHFKH